MKQWSGLFVLAVAGICGCGVGSVAPLVTGETLIDEPRLAGTWKGAKESAVITPTGPGTFDLTYKDESGKSGQFHARFGRLGSLRILDLEPGDPAPAANDAYKSLILRAHGIIVVDSVTNVIQFRLLEVDSLKAYLRQNPQAVAHTLVADAVLLTASSAETHRFLAAFVQRPHVLSEREEWQRGPR
jgi:hypothetical protein